MLPDVVFTVDGSPVEFDGGWSFGSSADLGYDQFRGVAPASRAKRVLGGIDQGSLIDCYTEHGVRIGQFRVPQPPKVSQDGLVLVAAQGHGYDAVKSGNRVSPIVSAPGAWIPANIAPINFPSSSVFEVVSTNTLNLRRITPSIANGGSFGSDWAVAFAAPGMNLNRFDAFLQAIASAQNEIWRIFTAQLPDVERTATLRAIVDNASDEQVSLKGIGKGFSTSVEFEPSDVVIVQYFDAFGGTVGSRNITNPKVWGDFDPDLIYAHHGARIVARQLGWDDVGVTGFGTVPLGSSDWAGDGAGYLSYIAGLEDFCWGVWDDQGSGPLVTFDRYGGPMERRTWEVTSTTGARWDLDPLERIRKVSVQFRNVDNTVNEVAVIAPDSAGLPDSVQAELKGSLVDAQENTQLAVVSAWRLLHRFLATRYRGRISVVHAYERGSGRDAPFEIRSGDLIRIVDFAVDESLTLRVHDVQYGGDGVMIGVEAAAFPLGGAISGRTGVGFAADVSQVSGGAPTYVPPGAGGPKPIFPYPTGPKAPWFPGGPGGPNV